ncbi:bifunctional diguanylate cyclase/phosphodiesterase [Roseibium sediminicola]|uniref:EAL domain-containing protein n=1 Tax=Roseibium sediminicola TaxID=2933272 RepID=A0ABT0GZD1_9HYPH|nr:EAL domain-containing protein [Roseibium sp. CAU 1639]MCK7614791.1 EAL domain-containing protein [Roseibium sp. CAU 1639]
MKIRTYLVFSFLVAALLPTLIFSVWSYRDAVSREFAEVKDRHLLLAHKAGLSLDRYQRDLVTTFKAVSRQLSNGGDPQEFVELLGRLNLCSVLLTDKYSGRVTASLSMPNAGVISGIDVRIHDALKEIAQADSPTFSKVTALSDDRNVLFLVQELEQHYAIGLIDPDFFIELGKSIVFGEKGHAAIVDQTGTVIAHPRPDWVKERKNLSQISAVARMMKGETGIETFYSPAVEKDMIAGFTTVNGPGWGVMVPQPVSEIYDKVSQNQSSLLAIVAAALLATVLVGLALARSLSRPLERLALAMHTSARNRKLAPVDPVDGPVRFTEITDFCDSYNRMVARMTKAGEQIEKLAFSDHVTGLPNRDHLQAVAERILKEATETGQGGVLLLIDLDNFKEVNDLHGHHVGDLHLKACARTLASMAEGLDLSAEDNTGAALAPPLVARIGGDEFIVMIQGLRSNGKIRTFLEDLLLALSVPSTDLSVSPSASIGCARFPEDGRELEELMKRADIAMYHAKHAGKNRMQIYSPAIGTQSAAETRRDLIAAIDNNQLHLEYQPKICTRRRKVISVEALARWDHPELGCLLPEHWIPLLNGSHAMNRLGEWVIAQAMEDHGTLAREGHDLWVSVNIGSNHFVSPGFIDAIETIRSNLRFDCRQLELEVTEDALFASEQRALTTFTRLHELGYRVSIDDFGTGYSNITRLAGLPVDFLKIDQSLITGASADPRIRTILASTIDMAEKLGCFTVAEGIETRNQAEFATLLGANCLQGRYFTQGLPLADLMSWLELQKGPAGHVYLRPESAAI